MAVTQQLNRLSDAHIEAASLSLAALQRIVSFEYESSPFEVLDLNWAPFMLERAATVLGKQPLCIAFVMACEGAEVVNPEFPDCLGEVYSEVRFNSVSRVEELSRSLAGFSTDWCVGVGALLPELSAELRGAEKLERYLRDCALALAQFYARAAAAKQVVVTWWD
jgi:hypothetical protein